MLVKSNSSVILGFVCIFTIAFLVKNGLTLECYAGRCSTPDCLPLQQVNCLDNQHCYKAISWNDLALTQGGRRFEQRNLIYGVVRGCKKLPKELIGKKDKCKKFPESTVPHANGRIDGDVCFCNNTNLCNDSSKFLSFSAISICLVVSCVLNSLSSYLLLIY